MAKTSIVTSSKLSNPVTEVLMQPVLDFMHPFSCIFV